MALHCISINHHRAPLEVREQLAFSHDQLLATLNTTASRRRSGTGALQEIAILSTCNRTELYAASPSLATATEGSDYLAESLEVDSDLVRRYAMQFEGEQTVRHLARVAAGLESMVLGESEILGQVSEAIRLAAGAGASGTELDRLFRTAVRAGKRARTETAIGTHPASVGSVWFHLAGQTFETLAGRHGAILGAGRMAAKALTTLRSRGAGTITLLSRRQEQGKRLIAGSERSEGFDALERVLSQCDIVVCATSAGYPLVAPDLVARARRGATTPLVIVDLGIPRNVHPETRTLDAVHLIDMNDIQQSLEHSVDQRRGEIPAVEAIVDDQVSRHRCEGGENGVLPVLDAIRRNAEDTRRREVARIADRLPDVSPEVRAEIETMSRSLVNAILATPSQRLRKEAANGHAEECARLARELFGLTHRSS